jgi:hypothetical protein
MYSFQRSENVPGVKQPIRMGYPENTYPDVCLCTDTSLNNYIPLNSAMLRDALLNSKQLLESMGLKVVDVKAAKEVAEAMKPKPKAKAVVEIPAEVKGSDCPVGEKGEVAPSVKEHKEGEEEWN